MAEIKPIADATVFVGDGDYIQFAPGSLFSTGATIGVISPAGSRMTLTRTGASLVTPGGSAPPVRFYLTGVSPPTGGSDSLGADQWTRSGVLSSAEPADGTWVIEIAGLYASHGPDNGSDDFSRPVTLHVGGKTIRYGYRWTAPSMNSPQLFNWHIAGAAFDDAYSDQAVPDAGSTVTVRGDTRTDPEEDPNNARFFRASGLVDSQPQVLPISDATVFVSDADYIEFAGGVVAWSGATYEVTAPNGEQVIVTRTGLDETDAGPPYPPVRFYLTGVNGPTGGVGETGADQWTREGVFDNTTPCDGTWTIRVSGAAYVSHGPDDGSLSYRRPVSLSVGGKIIRFGVRSISLSANNPQLFNWRVSGASFNDYGADEFVDVGTGIDPVTEPEEDPFRATYFVPVADAPLVENPTVPPSDPEYLNMTQQMLVSVGKPVTS